MLEFISHILHIKKKTEVKNGSLIFKHPTNTGAVNNQEGGEYYDYYSETSKNPKAVMFQSPEEENPNGAVQGIAYLDLFAFYSINAEYLTISIDRKDHTKIPAINNVRTPIEIK